MIDRNVPRLLVVKMMVETRFFCPYCYCIRKGKWRRKRSVERWRREGWARVFWGMEEGGLGLQSAAVCYWFAADLAAVAADFAAVYCCCAESMGRGERGSYGEGLETQQCCLFLLLQNVERRGKECVCVCVGWFLLQMKWSWKSIHIERDCMSVCLHLLH